MSKYAPQLIASWLFRQDDVGNASCEVGLFDVEALSGDDPVPMDREHALYVLDADEADVLATTVSNMARDSRVMLTLIPQVHAAGGDVSAFVEAWRKDTEKAATREAMSGMRGALGIGPFGGLFG